MRDIVKSCLSLVAGDYRFYRVYALDLLPPPLALRASPEVEFQVTDERAPESVVLSALIGGAPAATCWLWWGERYHRERNFLPLGPKEAKLVHIETHATFRGRGVASQLLAFAAIDMRMRGFERLYARIWHNNVPSIRAFTQVGWTYDQTVLELDPLRLGRRMRMSIRGTR